MNGDIFSAQKKHFLTLRKASRKIQISRRLELLSNFEKMILENKNSILQALREDLGKHETESLITEIYPTLSEIKVLKKNIKLWSRPQNVDTPLLLTGTKSQIQLEPKGTCLVLSPWNYPFQLSLTPAITAIAAGNTVILKPSELSVSTSVLIEKLCAQYFQPEDLIVMNGDKFVAQELLNLPFDHIFFTGSTQVGRKVMAAAANSLASVTLELGGKSPTIIDRSANIDAAAERVAWGKFVNAGQTCIAPDYVIVHEERKKEFVEKMRHYLLKFYGADPLQSDSYAHIISAPHLKRQFDLVYEAQNQGAQVLAGGKMEMSTLKMTPTLIENVKHESRLMQEEIFGPILPILTFREIESAIDFINSKEKPLALYIFSRDKNTTDRILAETSSGGVSINETLLHIANHHLPFGGVNASGLGAYHGYAGFKEFSHSKSILQRKHFGSFLSILMPPYKGLNKRLANWIAR